MKDIEKELLYSQLKRQGECRMVVGGFCMEPAVYDGATITIHPADTLNPGDIVAYFIESRLFAHRLVIVDNGRLHLRADTGKPDDHTIPSGAVFGKVVHVQNPSLVYRWINKLLGVVKRMAAG